MDAVDRLSMRTSEFLRAGKHEESVFSKKKGGAKRTTTGKSFTGFRPPAAKRSNIGLFEVNHFLFFVIFAYLIHRNI